MKLKWFRLNLIMLILWIQADDLIVEKLFEP